jgi:hypothetical protein
MNEMLDTFQGVVDGRTKNELYNTFQLMMRRCYAKEYESYKNYGAKGVKVSSDWMGIDGFWNFVRDMSPRPQGLTLDRIDPTGDYCKENCRWETDHMQANNTRLENINNTSGVAGVSWCVRDLVYIVQISLNGTRTRIGVFSEENLNLAEEVYLQAKEMKLLGYSDPEIYDKFVISKRPKGSKGIVRRNKTSKYWGVSYIKKANNWQAYTTKYLGVRKTEEEAYRLVQDWLSSQEELQIGPTP